MIFLGHVTQAAHLLLGSFCAYLTGRKRYGWVTAFAWGGIFLTEVFDGCPFTILANRFFTAGGGRTYDTLVLWLNSLVGRAGGAAAFLALLIPFLVALCVSLGRGPWADREVIP